MPHSIIQSAASVGQSITLKMFDNTTIKGRISALDANGFAVVDSRVINLAQVREVHVSEQAMNQILADARPLTSN